MERMGRFDREPEPAPAGVTSSVDWDEDPESYSGPV